MYAYTKIIFNIATYNYLIYSNLKYKENKMSNNKEIRSRKHMAAKILVAPGLAKICFVYRKYNKCILWQCSMLSKWCWWVLSKCKSLRIDDDNFIIFKQYHIYNYTLLHLKVVHNWLVCYQKLKINNWIQYEKANITKIKQRHRSYIWNIKTEIDQDLFIVYYVCNK